VAVQVIWFVVLNVIFVKWWCPPRLRPAILRAFGARIGTSVLIRHGVRIHLPWKLKIGDNSWIGEDTWIINLEPAIIDHDVCISQGAMLCCGSHRWETSDFQYDNGPIVIKAGAWVGARAIVLRGVTVHEHAVVGAGAVAQRDVPAGRIVTTSVASRFSGAASNGDRAGA
jgi:putative colanic acid biosynthesis acetyltransferase WcaF